MYQRYYKTRKFGRIFSFVLVIGSGLSHYTKSSYKFIKSNFTFENFDEFASKYELFPSNLNAALNNIRRSKQILNELKLSNDNKSNNKHILNEKEKLNYENEFFAYKNNLNKFLLTEDNFRNANFKNNLFEDEQGSNIKDQAKLNNQKNNNSLDKDEIKKIKMQDLKLRETYYFYKYFKNKLF